MTAKTERAFIDIKDVNKWYPIKKKRLFQSEKSYVKALGGVSLRINRGEVLGVIGESGCGKSTFARILARLEEPTAGDVIIDGISSSDLLKKDSREFRRKVQIIFQNPFDTFTPRDTIAQILDRALRIHGIGTDKADRRTMQIDALEKSGLIPAEDILKRYPHELSGGQLQRISIIRAMFFEPEFLIADEPVSMLDVSVRADIINTLLDISKSGKAVVFISHDIALTRYISHKIAVMYLGKVVEYGDSDVVVSNPIHPYTRALISNCASIDPEEEMNTIRLEGEPPTPIDPGPGCYFLPRCYEALETCTCAYPELKEVEAGHFVSCFNSEDQFN